MGRNGFDAQKRRHHREMLPLDQRHRPFTWFGTMITLKAGVANRPLLNGDHLRLPGRAHTNPAHNTRLGVTIDQFGYEKLLRHKT